MLKLRHEAGDGADRYQVYSGEVRVGAIYRAHNTPGGDRWFWGLNGVENGPGCGPARGGGGLGTALNRNFLDSGVVGYVQNPN
jgi:hypothetical protein